MSARTTVLKGSKTIYSLFVLNKEQKVDTYDSAKCQ